MRTLTVAAFGLVVAALLDRPALNAQHHNAPNVLTADEIARSNATTAYEAVETLRPRWLQGPRQFSHVPSAVPGTRTGGLPREFAGERSAPSNQGSPREPGTFVYLNETSVGNLDYLKTIPARAVLEMRWLSSFDAASRFGPTDGQAAIVLTLQQRGSVKPRPPSATRPDDHHP